MSTRASRLPAHTGGLHRSRRYASDCRIVNIYYHWTGCNNKYCHGEEEEEVDKEYCWWEVAYDRKCKHTDRNNCLLCQSSFYLVKMGSFNWCSACAVCLPNQYRTGFCSPSSFDNFRCTSCGIAAVEGKRGAFVPSASGADDATDSRSLALRTTISTANSYSGFSACRCPANYGRT